MLHIVNFLKCYSCFSFASYSFTSFSNSYCQVTHNQEDFIHLISTQRNKIKREKRRVGGKQKGRESRKTGREEEENSLLRKTILNSGGDTFPSLNDLIWFYQQRLEGLGVTLPLLSFPSRDVRDIKSFHNTSDNITRNCPLVLKAGPPA